MEIGKLEYRVRPVTRYVVTRYYETPDGRTGGTEIKGEFDNGVVAHEVAYALCKDEHDRLGWLPDDSRIQYPVLNSPIPDNSPVRHYATLGPA